MVAPIVAAGARALGPVALGVGTTLLSKNISQKEGTVPGGQGFHQGTGAMGTLGVTLAGAVSGAALKIKDLDPNATPRERVMAGLTGVLAGGGAGYLADKTNDAIQSENGGLKAMVFGAGSSALASTLQEGGPSMFQSGIAGAGTSYAANSLHDNFTDKGYTGVADMIAGGLQGGTLGYAALGDLQGASVGGGLGVGGGFVTNMMEGNNNAQAAFAQLSPAEQEMQSSSRAQQAIDAQMNGGVMGKINDQVNSAQVNSVETLMQQQQPQRDDSGMSL